MYNAAAYMCVCESVRVCVCQSVVSFSLLCIYSKQMRVKNTRPAKLAACKERKKPKHEKKGKNINETTTSRRYLVSWTSEIPCTVSVTRGGIGFNTYL